MRDTVHSQGGYLDLEAVENTHKLVDGQGGLCLIEVTGLHSDGH